MGYTGQDGVPGDGEIFEAEIRASKSDIEVLELTDDESVRDALSRNPKVIDMVDRDELLILDQDALHLTRRLNAEGDQLEVFEAPGSDPVASIESAKPEPVEAERPAGRALAGTGDVYAHAGDRPTLPSIEEADKAEMPAELVRKSDIVSNISKVLGNIPIRIGRLGRGGAHGIYKGKGEAIRTRRALDIPVIAHELGHHINKLMHGGEKGRLNYKPLKPFAAELEAIATPSGKDQPSVQEGFAEFVRMYITNPAEAAEKAPKFHADFEKRMEAFPEVRELLTDTREQVRRYIEQPAAAKVLAHISKEDTDRSVNRWSRLYTQTLDKLHPIKEAVTGMSKRNGKDSLPTEKNAYELARLMAGWMGKADHFLNRGTFNAKTLEVTGKPLQEILKPIEGKLDDLRIYMTARRTIEKLEQGKESGIDKADAEAAIAQIESPEIKAAAEELYAYQDKVLEYLVESGYMSQEQFERIKSMNKDYVPFYRVMEEGKGGAGGGSSTMADLWNPVKRMKGSTREIVDPLESIIKNTYSFIGLAERNRVGQALAEQAETTEGSARWVEKVPAKMQPVSVNLSAIRKTMEEAGIDLTGVDADALNTMATVFRPASTGSPGENIVSVFRDGKPELYQLDPDLYSAVKSLDEESTNLVIKILAKPASALRAGATALSPEFLSRNPIRDAATAFLQSKNGFMPGVDTFRGLFHALKKDDLYTEWQRAGGEQAALVSMDRTTLKKNLDEMLASPMKMAVRHPIEALRMISEFGEAATRLGEYKLAKKKGATPAAAAFASRDVTLDFARVGSATRALNQIVAFWNASVQGTDRLVTAHMDNPKGTVAKAVAGLTVPTLVLYALNHDDEDYAELPRWQKDFFWMIPTKGTPLYKHTRFIPVPKPFLWGVIYSSAPERALDFIAKKDKVAFKGLLNSIQESSLPGYIPTAILPAIEWWANKSMFKGTALVPGYLERLPAEYQYTPWTSEFSKRMGEMFAKAGLQVSPIKIENSIFGVSAGAGRAALKITDPLFRGPNAPEKPSATMADTPGLRAFAIRFPSGATVSIQGVYERLNKLDQKKAALDFARKTPGVDVEPMTGLERRDHSLLKSAARRMSNLTSAARRIELSDTMTAEEKRTRLDELAERRLAYAQRVMKIIKKDKV